MVNTTLLIINTALICLILYKLKWVREPTIPIQKSDFSNSKDNEITIAFGDKTYSSRDLIHMYSKHGGVQVVTKHEEIFIWESLSKIQNRLPDSFIRCHRSHIINGDQIESVADTEILLKKGFKIPIGKTYQSNINRTNSKTGKENIENN